MASLEAREIMLHVTGKDRLAIARDYHLYAPPAEEAQALALMRRRLEGEPIAYIVGEWEFFGLTLEITPDVLIPRIDTEVLTSKAIALTKQTPGARVLDLCAGSGCVGLAVAAYAPDCQVILADISEAARAVAWQNIRLHDLFSRVAVEKVNALSPAPADLGVFDVIACNPPYVKTCEMETLEAGVRCFEPRQALDGGADGLLFFRKVAFGWRSALKPDGTLLFECGQGQAPAVRDIMRRAAYGHIDALRDTQDVERVVMGMSVWNDDIRDVVVDI